MSATAVTKRHAVTTTLHGEVLIFERGPHEEPGNGPREPAYRFELPGSIVTTSSPAIADGRIVFGADDGCLYVLGPGGRAASTVCSTSSRRLGEAVSDREWPGAFGYGVVAYGSKYETPRGTRTLVGPAQRWRIAPGEPPPEWYRSTFDDGDWGDSTIANDGSVFAWRDRRSPTRETTYLRTRFRVATASATGDRSEAFAIVCGPRDELAVYVDGDKVFQTPGWEDGSFPEAAKYVGVAARVVPLDFTAEPGEHCLAITATNKGIYTTDLSTGEMVAKTPGFASQTCPHPVVANGLMFYSPQNNGMLYCFEPDSR